MISSGDNRLKNFEQLREHRDEYGYPEKLLKDLQGGFFNCLNEINIEDRNNKAYMEPLLFAVKNSEFGTYEVFKYYGEELQKREMEMAIEIVVNEPKVLENTPFTEDSMLVLKLAENNPEIIRYISEDLRNDGKFIEELCKSGHKEAIEYAIGKDNVESVIQGNLNLLQNSEFMKQAIKEDATLIALVSENLKDNYEFIKEASKENREVIDYIAEHTYDFGKEGIKAAKEVLTENTTCRAIDEFQTELEKVQEEIASLESKEGFDKDSKEYKDLLLRKRHAENGIKFMDKIRNMQDPRRALELIDRLCVGKSEEYKQDLIKYFKLDDAVIAKGKEENSTGTKIEPKDVENAAKETTLSDVHVETSAIRDEMTADKEQIQSNEIGEQ